MKVTNPYNNEFEIWVTGTKNVDLDTVSLKELLKLVDVYNKEFNLI